MNINAQNLQPILSFINFNDNWNEYKLNNICERIQDGTHFSLPVSTEGSYKYVTSKNIRNGYLDKKM